MFRILTELLTNCSIVEPSCEAFDEALADFWERLLGVNHVGQSSAAKVAERVQVTLGAKVWN